MPKSQVPEIVDFTHCVTIQNRDIFATCYEKIAWSYISLHVSSCPTFPYIAKFSYRAIIAYLL